MLYFKHKFRRRKKIVWKKVKDIVKITNKRIWTKLFNSRNFIWRKINLCDFFFLSFLGISINYTENRVVRMYYSIW